MPKIYNLWTIATKRLKHGVSGQMLESRISSQETVSLRDLFVSFYFSCLAVASVVE